MTTLTKQQQQMAMLGQLLKTQAGRERLTSSLVTALAKRKRVDITSLGKMIAESCGEDAAVHGEKCLMDAVQQATHIFLMDGKEAIMGTCVKLNDKWFVRRNDEAFPVCAGDFLTCYAPDGSRYWQGVVDENTPSEETDKPFVLQWDGELVKENAEEDNTDD
jgi:hypothetical protein